MVSFQCEGCGDVLTKKKLDAHRNQCRGATYSCLDCMTHFQGVEYRAHTSCISEAQKYQGALYRPEKEKKNRNNNNNNASKAVVPHKAYVEDAPSNDSSLSLAPAAMPEAPSPPQAVPNFQPEPVNVFDFLVGEGTPNPSTLNLAAAEERRLLEAAPSSPSAGALVRFQDLFDDDDDDDLVQYGSGPVPAAAYRTPAAKSDRKSKTKDLSTSEKKDKKRKRLHVDTAATGSPDVDQEMTDAPPVLHSGLTGGLQRMMSRPDVFPPSPDYSGDAGEPSPGSPLKRSKHKKGKHDRDRDISLGSQLMSVFTSSKRSSKDHDGERPKKSRKKREHSSQKLLEYKPTNGETNGNHQLVVYKERGDMFMSLIDKGPESERGLSVNKVLRRYHRHRAETGSHLSKATEEKQLFRNLRLRKNDRGEIVLFCEESK